MQATLTPPVPAALLPTPPPQPPQPQQQQQQQQQRGFRGRGGRGGGRHTLPPQATCAGLSGEQLYKPSFSQDPWAALT